MEVLLSWCVISPLAEQCSGCTVHSHGVVQCINCVHLSVVRCQPCHCRRVWRETCSSVCKLGQVSSDHIWAKEQNERSSESKRSEKKVHTLSVTVLYIWSVWTIWGLWLYRHNRLKFWFLAQANKPSHSFYSGASCEWRWKELCRQCKSCRLHQAPNREDLQRASSTVNTTGTCHQPSFCPASFCLPSF